MNKVLKFGIAPVPVQRACTLAIAAGTRQRGKDEPNVWFSTVTAMARVLSDENMALLKQRVAGFSKVGVACQAA
jgi:predicted transcriptional regulator